MNAPLQITFRDVEVSEAVEARIREKADKLFVLCDRITALRVTVARPHRSHVKGKLFHIRVDVTMPHAELVVGRDPSENHEHEDVYAALRDAFKTAERLVKEAVDRMRGEVKAHTAARTA